MFGKLHYMNTYRRQMLNPVSIVIVISNRERKYQDLRQIPKIRILKRGVPGWINPQSM